MSEVPINCIWAATGNNLQYSPEIQRRVVKIRLDTDVESPSLRQDFTIPDIIGYVDAHRANILTAGLYMVKAWLDRDRPLGNRILGSYETWSRTMGGLLDVIGVEGFLTEDRTGDNNDEVAGKAELVWRWWLHHADREVSVKDLLSLVDELDLGFYLSEGSQPALIQFKRWMNTATDTVAGGRKIVYTRMRNGMRHYRLQVVDKAKHQQDTIDRNLDKKGNT